MESWASAVGKIKFVALWEEARQEEDKKNQFWKRR